MCCFAQCCFFVAVLLIAIANPLPENNIMDGPLPDAFPLGPEFDTSSSATVDQLQNDLTLVEPGDYADPDVAPYDWFLPHCKTPHTLCCTRLPLPQLSFESILVSKIRGEIGGNPVVFGCSTCTPRFSNLHHTSN